MTWYKNCVTWCIYVYMESSLRQRALWDRERERDRALHEDLVVFFFFAGMWVETTNDHPWALALWLRRERFTSSLEIRRHTTHNTYHNYMHVPVCMCMLFSDIHRYIRYITMCTFACAVSCVHLYNIYIYYIIQCIYYIYNKIICII